jgi:hypothetical protein
MTRTCARDASSSGDSSLSQLVRGAAVLAIQSGTEHITKELLDLVPVDHAAQRSSAKRPGRRSNTRGKATAKA